ncbi:hypothetical protein FQN50_003873 [Emmonsiellopsis sp. PD_5]|nr:hypothetical protein FQN50_003873 [Emmonsiellopsis sp. PD_5]
MSSWFDSDEVPFLKTPPGLSRRYLHNNDLLVQPLVPVPSPPKRSTLHYPIKGSNSNLRPFEHPPGDEDFSLLFSDGNTPPLSEDEDEPPQNPRITRLARKIINFDREFNPRAWMVHVPALMDKLTRDPAPGTFRHFLRLLLEPCKYFERSQLQMQAWLAERYIRREIEHACNPVSNASRAVDKQQLLAEIKLLRKLVAPLRQGNDGLVVDWKKFDLQEYGPGIRSLTKAYKIIKEFETDISCRTLLDEEDEFMPDDKADESKMAMLSMRMIRLDVCKKSLSDDPPRSSTHPPPAKTDEMEGGKTPVQHKKPKDPEPHSPRTMQDILKYKLDLSKCKGGSGDVIDTLLNIARWLMKARSTEAVDLFCDVARMFTAHEPPTRISDERYSLLRTLSDVMLDFNENTTRKRPRATTNPGNGNPVNINMHIPGPSNWEYSRDAAVSRRSLIADLRLRMNTEHPDPAEKKHGQRLTSHSTVKKEQTDGRPDKLPPSATHIIAYTVAMERRSALPVDPSNWAANQEPRSSREEREEMQEEVKRITREMDAEYERKLRAWERAEEERLRVKEMEKEMGMGNGVVKEENKGEEGGEDDEDEDEMLYMKEKPRFEKPQPQPQPQPQHQPATNDLAQALKEHDGEATKTEIAEMEMENEKPIVFEHKPRAKEQLDKNEAHIWSTF